MAPPRLRAVHGDATPPVRRRRHYWLQIGGVMLIAGIAFRGALLQTYMAAYPSDAFERGALRECALANPSFIRFLADDRAACYARLDRHANGPATVLFTEPAHHRAVLSTTVPEAAAPVPYAGLDLDYRAAVPAVDNPAPAER